MMAQKIISNYAAINPIVTDLSDETQVFVIPAGMYVHSYITLSINSSFTIRYMCVGIYHRLTELYVITIPLMLLISLNLYGQ